MWTIIQVAYNIMISREMAMAYDPLESGFICLVYVCPITSYAPLCTFCGAFFSLLVSVSWSACGALSICSKEPT